MEFQEEELFYFIVKMVELIESNYSHQQYLQVNSNNVLLSQDTKILLFNNLFAMPFMPGSPEEKNEMAYLSPAQVKCNIPIGNRRETQPQPEQ